MSLSCSEATTRLNALDRLNEQFRESLKLAQTGAATPAEAKAALKKAQQLKVQLETGMQGLSRELVVEIIVPEAINPYAEGLKEAGLPPNHPECKEQKEITFNLDEVIEHYSGRVRQDTRNG